MTAAKKTPPKADTPLDPLLERPIPHAYALVPHPTKEGLYYAVHLRNVVAEGLDHLELSGRPSAGPFGLNRITQAMEMRHRTHGWGDK